MSYIPVFCEMCKDELRGAVKNYSLQVGDKYYCHLCGRKRIADLEVRVKLLEETLEVISDITHEQATCDVAQKAIYG